VERSPFEVETQLDKLSVQRIEDTGVFPVDTYWIPEDWWRGLKSHRTQLTTVLDWSTMIPLGLMVYSMVGEFSVLEKMTVNDEVPTLVFESLLKEFLDKCHTPRTSKFTTLVHRNDRFWRAGFEMNGFLTTGSITTSQGETYDRYTKFK